MKVPIESLQYGEYIEGEDGEILILILKFKHGPDMPIARYFRMVSNDDWTRSMVRYDPLLQMVQSLGWSPRRHNLFPQMCHTLVYTILCGAQRYAIVMPNEIWTTVIMPCFVYRHFIN